jgi:hypothetical protein
MTEAAGGRAGRSLPVRDVEHADVAADDRGELAGAGIVGPQRPPDAQEVGAKPERVAALNGAGRLDAAERRDARGERPPLEHGGLTRAVGLARPERDGAAVGDQQRVEDVDEVRVVVGLGVEDADGDPEPFEDETRPSLAAREIEVDGPRKPQPSTSKPARRPVRAP